MAIIQFVIFFFLVISLADTFTTSDNRLSYSLSTLFSVLSPLNNSAMVIPRDAANGSIRDTSGNFSPSF